MSLRRKSVDLIFISYESGDYSSCPAEWADDKSFAFSALGLTSVLITNLGSSLPSSPVQRVIKVPSLSSRDFSGEYEKFRANDLYSLKIEIYRRATFFIGKFFDFLFSRMAGNLGFGRWSWSVNAFLAAFWQLLLNHRAVIFASGGPSSAHFSAVLAGIVTGRKVILEFQDPFVGSEMQMSSLAWKVFKSLEEFLIRRASKTVFVTQTAAREVKARFPHLSGKIQGLYPGAPDFDSEQIESLPWSKEKIVLLHLGTLYGDRNLKLLFSALDEVYSKRPKAKGSILVANLGNIYLPEIEEYRARGDFMALSPVPRPEALGLARQADYLLLVQHIDSRSKATIPYKTYDYLNLGRPVLGLLNNPELAELLELHGGKAINNTDLSSLASFLLDILDKDSAKFDVHRTLSQTSQVKKLLELS